jgi:hypothetical protein
MARTSAQACGSGHVAATVQDRVDRRSHERSVTIQPVHFPVLVVLEAALAEQGQQDAGEATVEHPGREGRHAQPLDVLVEGGVVVSEALEV